MMDGLISGILGITFAGLMVFAAIFVIVVGVMALFTDIFDK